MLEHVVPRGFCCGSLTACVCRFRGTGNQSIEKRAAFRGVSIHAFGVPLYADGKRVRVDLDGFNRTILSPGAYGYIFPGGIHSLMMEAVHKEASSGILSEETSAADMNSVACLAPAGGVLHMV